MKVVVTGALGHIGSRLIRDLAQDFPGVEIVLVDALATQRYASLFNLPPGATYRFVEADILAVPLEPLFRGAHAVVHLAAVTDATASFEMKDRVEAVNLGGTERVARACAEARTPLVFVSTTSVYGSQRGLVDEDCPEEDLKPQSPYAASKLAAERLLVEMGKTTGLRFTTLRFGTIFGTSIGMRFHTAVNRFCWQAVMGSPLSVWRTALHQKRPYLDLGDGVRAIGHVLRHQLFRNELYNVVSHNATVQEVVDAIRESVPDVRLEFVDAAIMNQLSYEVSSRRFVREGFEFRGDLRRGVRETIEMLRRANATTTASAPPRPAMASGRT